MRFTAELTFAPRSPAGAMDGPSIADLARRAERQGFDAIAFNEHPAPSVKWLDSGGHDAFDPIASLSFCAAVTERARLMAYTVNLPYRNPFLLAKSLASVDVLSGGRTIVVAGVGYLRSEFAALGVDFNVRNEVFDESIGAMRAVWADEPVAARSTRFHAVSQTATPRPVRHGGPPLWIGGNGPRARQRVADHASGWSPLLTGEIGARTARTVAITDLTALAGGMKDLRRRLDASGRDPNQVDVQVQSPESDAVMSTAFDVGAHVEYLGRLAELGVTQFIVHLVIGDGRRADDALDRYGETVIRRFNGVQ